MSAYCRRFQIMLLPVVCLIVAAPVQAAIVDIPIVNGSFEDPPLADGGLTQNSVPGWTGQGESFHVINPVNHYFPNTTDGSGSNPIDGRNAVALNFTASVSQELGAVVGEDIEYTLVYLAGQRTGVPFGTPTVRLWAGDTLLVDSTPSPASGVFEEVSVVYRSPESGDPIGQPLRVEIAGSGVSAQAWFDHVRLAARALTPEPAFFMEPQSQVVLAGATVAFRVSMYGDPPFSYQWQWNGVDLDGETGDSLVLTDVELSDEGEYTVMVENAFGSVISAPATLTLAEPPSVVTQPVSQSVFQGEPVTFSVTAAGTEPLDYQWLHNGIEIPGANDPALALDETTILDVGTYTVRVENAVGSAVSEAAQLTFKLAPGQIFIANHSFEDPALEDGGLTDDLAPGWADDGGSFHVGNLIDDFFAGTSEGGMSPNPIDGNNAVALNNFSKIYQELADNLKGNHEYRLSFLAGHRRGVSFGSAAVRLLAGDTLLAESLPAPADGEIAAGSLVYRAPTFGATIGEPLRIELAGSGLGAQAWFDAFTLISEELPPEPSIHTHPTSQLAALGATVTLHVAVNGEPPFDAQWQFNGVDMEGEVGQSLVLTDVDYSDAGEYTVRVSNGFGSVTSNPAVVEVLDPPTITVGPTGQSVFEGDPVTFRVTAAGEPPLSYQWLHEGAEIPGATDAALILADTSIRDLGAYSVRVENAVGSVVSDPAQLTFVLAPGQVFIANASFEEPLLADGGISANSVPGWAGEGNAYQIINPINAYFPNTTDGSSSSNPIHGRNAAALNGPATMHQNLGVPLAGSTEYIATYLSGHRLGVSFGAPAVRLWAGDTLLVESLPVPPEGGFTESMMRYESPESGVQIGQLLRLEIEASVGGSQAWFDQFRLHVRALTPEPGIQTQPMSRVVAVGGSVTFSVSAYGDPPFSYQWRFNGVDLEGETGEALTLSNVQPSDAGEYTVMVSNEFGSVTSVPAVLEVAVRPTIVTQPSNQSIMEGDPATFTVEVAGTRPIAYQWRHNDVEIPGATGASFTLAETSLDDLGAYTVRAENVAGSVVSEAAQLVFVLDPGQIYIANHSFESPPLGDRALTYNTMPGWSGEGGAFHVINPNNSYFANTSDSSASANPIDGRNAAAVNDSTRIRQDLGVQLVGDANYTLSYLAGHRSGTAFGSPAVRLFAGDTLLIESLPPTPADGMFAEVSANFQTMEGGEAVGETLRLEIQGGGNATQAWFDNIRLSIRLLTPEPAIYEHPRSHAVALGDTVTLGVAAYGDPPFDYQWRFNGVDLEGETGAELVLNDMQFSDEGEYTVTVSNEFGSDTSDPAIVEVAEPPSILVSPAGRIVVPGESVTLQVEAAGTGPLSYQWFLNDVEIQGGTGAALVITDISFADLGFYTVRVENKVGSVLSDAAQVNFGLPYEPVAIANASFEDPPLVDGAYTSDEVPGWTGEGGTFHVINPSDSYIENTSDGNSGPNLLNGKNALALNNTSRVYQDLGVPLESGTEYVLIYGAGHRFGAPFGSPSVRLWAGDTLLVESMPALPPLGEFSENFATYRASDGGEPVGQTLRVEIQGSGSGAQSWFDHFRLLIQRTTLEPTIVRQPASQAVHVGTAVELSVAVQGYAPFTYQWQFNGGDIEGETSPTFVLEDAQLSDTGEYRVIVSNEYGVTVSDSAVVTVAEPPLIIGHPAGHNSILGGTVTFEVAAGGTGPLSYQWYHQDTEIAGANGSTLTLSNIQLTDAGTYHVRVGNVLGTVTSSPVYLELIGGSGDLVIPPHLASQEGAANAETFLAAHRMQELYESHLFPPTPILIREIRWRPDGPEGAEFEAGPVEVELKLSTTRRDADTLSLVFSDNTGSDETVVFDDSITLSSANTGPAGGPGDFDIAIPLSRPFLYDPRAGNLLVDIRIPVELTASAVDAASGSGGIARVVALDPNADQAVSVEGGADVIELNYTLGTHAPAVIHQPQDRISSLGHSVVFEVGVSGTRPLSYQWHFNGQPLAGQTNASLIRADLRSADAGDYVVVVSNEFGSDTSDSATLTLLSPPVIVEHPEYATVTEGDDATFSVVGGGDGPLSYQWFHNDVSLPGATESTLVLPQAQPSDFGVYKVQVSNPVGSVTSKAVALRVLRDLGRAVYAGVTSGSLGETVSLSVTLRAQGTENALGFSIGFDPSALAFQSVLHGAGAADASLHANETQVDKGRLGLALALPAGDTFPAGSQELVVINFTIIARTAPQAFSIHFSDNPVSLGISDPLAEELPARFIDGEVIPEEPRGLEGDVLPLPGGDLDITVTDWVQVGRYAAELDSISNSEQFQRADCAPRASLGDGMITVSDWVQAGRYFTGLDPWTAVGGPAGVLAPMTSGGGELPSVPDASNGTGRSVRIPGAYLTSGRTASLPVVLDGLGNENALGFSIHFDAGKVRLEGIRLGSDASNATLLVNDRQADIGFAGVVLALSSGRTFPARACELLLLDLTPVDRQSGGVSLRFGSSPIAREVADALANPLQASFEASILEILPSLTISREANSVVLTWPESAADYRLESTRFLGDAAAWKEIGADPIISGGEWQVVLPLQRGNEYFRLQK